jgi:predicted dehydrogenase
MKVGIIGCGLIGQKRANNLAGASLVACADENIDRAQQLAKNHANCEAMSDWTLLVNHPEVEIVVIATPHHLLAEMGLQAIRAGKHVLIEKPAGRFAHELKPLIEAEKEQGVCVRIGFNHRYHRALQQAKALVDEGALGELMFIRARYGHGGRVGYDKEWRSRPELSGGGELIDQGVHLIDLARWFLGDFEYVDGYAHTYFWDMPVDDNGFMLLKTAQKQTAFLHASCTEWKNTFSFEIYGKVGKLEIQGLGGSYGVERLAFYKMLPEMGPPPTQIWEYPMADNSWHVEFLEFLCDIQQQKKPAAGLRDAYAALDIVNQIYKDSGYDYCS